MARRRIFKLGRSSLVISLPKEWVKKYNLTMGDEVEVEERGDGVLEIHPISHSKKIYPLVIRYSNTKQKNLLERILIAAYISNRDPIIIEINEKMVDNALLEINKVVEKTRELEIIREAKKKKESGKILVLSSILTESFCPIKILMNRIVDLVLTMVKYLILAFDMRDPEYLDEIKYIEGEVDRVYLKLLRQLSIALNNSLAAKEMNITDFSELLAIRTIVQLVEIIADLINEIAGLTMDYNIQELIKNLDVHIIKNLLNKYFESMNILFKEPLNINIHKANEILNNLKDMRKICRNLTFSEATGGKYNSWLKDFIIRFSSMIEFLKVTTEILFDKKLERSEQKIRVGDEIEHEQEG